MTSWPISAAARISWATLSPPPPRRPHRAPVGHRALPNRGAGEGRQRDLLARACRPGDVVHLPGPDAGQGQDQLLLRARPPDRRASRMGEPDVGDHAMKLALESVGSGAANSGRSRLSAGVFLGLLLTAAVEAQTLHPLHVSPQGMILDDTGKPVLLRGLNRSGTGSGTADAASTDADYAAQNKLLS